MEGEIDFDPLTTEGRMDINDIVDDEYMSLLPQNREKDGAWFNRMNKRFGKGMDYAMDRLKQLFKVKNYDNPRAQVPEYLAWATRNSYNPIDPEAPTVPGDAWVDAVMMESNRAGLERVKDIFPRFNEYKLAFNWGRDSFGREILQVGLKKPGENLYTLIDGNGKYLRRELPEELKKFVGNRNLKAQKAAAKEDLEAASLELMQKVETNEDKELMERRERREIRGKELVSRLENIDMTGMSEEERQKIYERTLKEVMGNRKEELIEMKTMGKNTTSQEKIIKDLQDEITSLKQSDTSLRSKVLTMTNDIRQALKDLDDKDQELEEVKEELEEAKMTSPQDLEDAMVAIQSLQKMKENAEEQVKEYQDKLEEKENELKNVLNQKKLAADHFENVSKGVDAELKRLDIKVSEGNDRQETIEHLQGNFELLLKKLSEREKELKAAKAELAEAKKNNEAPSVIKELEDKIENLKREGVKTAQAMNDLNELIKQQKLRIGSMFKEMQNSVANYTEAVDRNKELIKEMALKDEQIRQLSGAVDDYERTIEHLRQSFEDERKTEEEKENIRKELDRLTTARDEKLEELEQEERERGYTRREKIIKYDYLSKATYP